MASREDEIAAWREALEKCLSTQSFATINYSTALVYADAPQVFYAAQALVQHENDQEGAIPLVVVMRLHPQITALLQTLSTSAPPHKDVDSIIGSLVFRDQASPVTSDGAGKTMLQSMPFFASRAVNVDGGALMLYGESDRNASEALTMVTLAMASSSTAFERFVVVVEHTEGYLGREYVATESTDPSARIFKIHKREWNSGSIAQFSLDDALEEYEAAFQEEEEINGVVSSQQHSLEISVNAAFEVRDQSRKALDSTFLLDSDNGGVSASSSGAAPAVVLFSQWGGLENVRSLVCKPPPQCTSTLLFSTDQKSSGCHQSLALLQHLEVALREGSCHRTWKNTDQSTSEVEVLEQFKRFLKNIDSQDEFYGGGNGGDDNTNNTIESTVSMALDGERDRERAHTATSRTDMDAIEKVWDFLTQHADGTDLIQQILQEFMVNLSNTRVFSAPHPENVTQLAQLMRLRHEEIQGHCASASFAASAQQLLSQPLELMALVIEAGEWKMMRDVAFWLAQTGFSSQECDEFVRAMPHFDVHKRDTTHVHWKAMDHVLQICWSGQSIHLPVAFMRKAVHDCVAFYARGSPGTTTGPPTAPAMLIDLQSFIPDRLRANLADPLSWNLRVAFNSDFEHRLQICQDAFHPTIKRSTTSTELVLDDATLRALHRHAPEQLLSQPDIVKFLTKLENDRERREYEQLHDMEMPTGMTRYDCTVRRLHVRS